MSDTCSLFPPFGDPWPSCLLPSQHAVIHGVAKSRTWLSHWAHTQETFLAVTLGEVLYWWHLVGRSQRCCETSYRARDRLPPHRLVQPQVSIVPRLGNHIVDHEVHENFGTASFQDVRIVSMNKRPWNGFESSGWSFWTPHGMVRDSPPWKKVCY